MSKANGHRWRFEHRLTDPELSREACTLNHLGIVLCDVLEELGACGRS